MKSKNNISQISRKTTPHPRPPTSFEAYLCLVLVGSSILLTSFWGGPIQFGIVLATTFAFLMAQRLGFTWGEMEGVIGERLGKLSGG